MIVGDPPDLANGLPGQVQQVRQHGLGLFMVDVDQVVGDFDLHADHRQPWAEVVVQVPAQAPAFLLDRQQQPLTGPEKLGGEVDGLDRRPDRHGEIRQ